MVPVDTALEIVLNHTPFLGTEDVPLAEALGRVLGEDVAADGDVPPFDRSAMDGYAVRAAECAQAPVTLAVAGQVRAGALPEGPLPPGQAIQIMTGAPVPEGATAVQPVEKTRPVDGGRRVEILESVDPGAHIAWRGSEVRAGDRVLSRGEVLDPSAIGVLAAVGKGRVRVGRRPTVSLVATGDELVDVWDVPSKGRIRNSNGYAVFAQARSAGAEVRSLGIVPDDSQKIAEAVREGFRSDVLVLSGGVSEGAFDLVEEVLARFDVGLHFARVAIKPGAPLVFGQRGGKLVFGLPGNPVSAQVTFDLFVRAALLRMQGARSVARPCFEVEILGGFKNRSGRRAYFPVRLLLREGRLLAQPIPTTGSADLFSHARANALVIMEPTRLRAEPGERAPALLLGNFLERDLLP
jgi:molybdopterin molybdotransferase